MTLTQRLYGLVPLGTLPKDTTPPNTLGRFMLHFLRQIWPLLAITVTLEAAMALVMALVPMHLGWIVDMVTRNAWDSHVLVSGTVVLLAIPTISLLLWWMYDHVYIPQFGNLLRRQLNHYTLGHAQTYFNNDYAGRIANKVLESGPALRDIVRSSASAVWYAGFFAISATVILASVGGIVVVPVLMWLAVYITALAVFVPKVRVRSMRHSDMHSTLVGRVVDTYTNISTIKLFARQRYEDDRGYQTLLAHTQTMRDTNHAVWVMRCVILISNGLMMVGTMALALWSWRQGQVSTGLVAMALPLVWQLNNMSTWIMNEVTSVFENLGRVEECMATIAVPHTVTDRPDAKPLVVTKGTIRFDNTSFHYGKGKGVMEGLDLVIAPGEKVGIVGRSGAGKSTLVNLLMRTHDLEGGRILVDGQDIARVTQDSLREQVAVVTQDNSLLNRTIRENLVLGRPEASEAQVLAAAKRAHAHDFILGLADLKGHKGYEAQVGERGVKLSGGQRQRIALARVFLKDAPILILDEATSALDSEAEEEILRHLDELMKGKTVLAIAHRLSTLKSMDRIVVMDKGEIVEDGSHASLLRKKGIYADLWHKQSGGFLPE